MSRRTVPFLAVAVALVAVLGTGSPAALAVPVSTQVGASTTAVGPPTSPVLVRALAFVDGIRVEWYRGSVTSTSPAPTSYVVTRSGADGEVSIPVGTAASVSFLAHEDLAPAVGESVTYTVTALGSGGSSDPSSPTDPVSRPPWEGPYDGARTALVAVWDAASTSGSSDTDLDSILADTEVRYGINGSALYGVDWRHSIEPVTAPDGSYEVGTDAGQLPLTVHAGVPCSTPSGTATVARTAYALSGLASQSVDAELDCDNGHHLSVAFRWRTPDPFPLVRLTHTVTMTVAPGGSGTGTATVRNDGTASLEVSAVRLAALPDGDPSGLSITGSTCSDGALAPGATCVVDVAFDPAAVATRESRALVVLDTPLGTHEAGTMVGQLDGRGQAAPTGISAPRGLRLAWSFPGSVASSLLLSYRVERQDVAGPTVVGTVSLPVSGAWQRDLGALPTGAYVYRVVLLTTDGRELTSAWTTVHVPESWLVLATTKGAVPVNPEDGWTTGGTFGSALSTSFPMSMAADPRRTSILAAVGNGYSGRITHLTPTTSTGSMAGSDVAPWVADVSPDGARALVVRSRVTQGTQVLDPGAVLVLDDVTSTLTEVPNSTALGSPRWLPDGSAFLAVAEGGRIQRVDPTTGARSTVLTDSNVSNLTVSRQGRMAFVRSDGWYDQSIVETSLTGAGRRLVATYALPGSIRYDPTGRYLFAGAHAWTEGEASRVYDLSASTPTLVAMLPLASDAAWWDPVSSAPTATVSVPAWTTRTPSLAVAASDPDDAIGGLALRCRLDGGDWTACSALWRPGTLAAGTHTAEVRVTDPAGVVGTRASTWRVDGTAPTASLATLASATLGSTLTFAWSAADTGGSGLKSYDLRYRRASTGSGFGAWATARSALTSRSASLSVSQGYQYCVEVRARDIAGNVGPWSAQRCTSVARDDRGLSAGSGWTRARSSSALDGTLTRASRSGVALSRSGVSARRIGLVATTCPTCGSVDVYVGSTKVGRLSLSSSATRSRQVRWLPWLSSTRTGTLTIRTTSSRPVSVDGFLVAH